MIIEILIGLIIAIICLYLFYLYLEWCDKYNTIKLHLADPILSVIMSEEEKKEYTNTLDSYGSFLLPRYLSDTYKPIRYKLLYTAASYA